ncbi:MAG: GNAT family N-acetyltransferase [Paracoccaceae bacterium]|nr:GNAT family N-acetyltransferase [Paracoccaceae bacterium]
MIEVGVTDDIDACLAVRRAVFIEEQNVPEEIEMDGLEEAGIHILLRRNGEAAGCARIMVKDGTGKIGRVAVLSAYRGEGLGKAVMAECLRVLRAMPEVTEARLGAQSYAIPFYEALGYRVAGPEYIEADIPHRPMVMAL